MHSYTGKQEVHNGAMPSSAQNMTLHSARLYHSADHSPLEQAEAWHRRHQWHAAGEQEWSCWKPGLGLLVAWLLLQTQLHAIILMLTC